MDQLGLRYQGWLLALPFSTQGETKHPKCLTLPTGHSNTHQEEEDNGHDHANNEILTLEEFSNTERLGVVVIQLAQFFSHLRHGQFVILQQFLDLQSCSNL